MELREIFAEVPDFRVAGRTDHILSEILVISLCAVISGADDFEEIAEYGRQKEAFLWRFLSLPSGIPSHDTFNKHLSKIRIDTPVTVFISIGQR